jgi:RimJ/RimL family protein N-acetyltransferase
MIRTFHAGDLHEIHRILDQAFSDGSKVEDEKALADRRSWLQWSILNQEWLPRLRQAPYGDRAIALKTTGELIGSIGYTPHLDLYEQIPELAGPVPSPGGFTTPELGFFWVIDPSHQRCGYATEAAEAMIDHAFKQLRLKRIIATTLYSNEASLGVMRKLGMRIARNPRPDPPWLQVVGFMDNPYTGDRDEL